MPNTKKLQTKKSCTKLTEKKTNQDSDKALTHSIDKLRSSSALSKSKSTNNKQNLKDLLKQSYIFIRQENHCLNHKLKRKHKKIEELKSVIRQYDQKLKQYEQTVFTLKQSRPVSANKNSQQKLRSSRNKYEDIVRQSQDIAKKSIEKYRKLQAKMDEERLRFEAQIQSLHKQNQSLKNQINKLQQNSNLQTTDRKKTKSYQKSDKKTIQIDIWIELKQLREKKTAWQRKQQQMKIVLAQISNKINLLDAKSQKSEQTIKAYEAKVQELEKKYQNKCKKQKQGNQKWAGIFKDFIKQTQFLGKQIDKIKNIFYLILKKQINRIEKTSPNYCS